MKLLLEQLRNGHIYREEALLQASDLCLDPDVSAVMRLAAMRGDSETAHDILENMRREEEAAQARHELRKAETLIRIALWAAEAGNIKGVIAALTKVY